MNVDHSNFTVEYCFIYIYICTYILFEANIFNIVTDMEMHTHIFI
jgi:hypothetical protein